MASDDEQYETGQFGYTGYQGRFKDSDEETEDASETESMKLFAGEFGMFMGVEREEQYYQPGDEEIIERLGKSFEEEEEQEEEEYPPNELELANEIYQERLTALLEEFTQLDTETHPEFIEGVEKLKKISETRHFDVNCRYYWQVERIGTDYQKTKKEIIEDCNEQRMELKENLILDMDEKIKEAEGETIEFTADELIVRTITKHNLRRRSNEPLTISEKRQRTSPPQITYMLDEADIETDVKLLNRLMNRDSGKTSSGSAEKNTTMAKNRTSAAERYENNYPSYYSTPKRTFTLADPLLEVRFEDGKLFYEKKWFHRGQNVYIESVIGGWVAPAIIVQIGSNELWIRKMKETGKTSVTLTDLMTGKFVIQRRS